MTDLPLAFSPEVTKARADGAPIVALESTIITHGMPYPQNLETAQRVEAEIRAHGAVPATIAVMAGKLHIGLTPDELNRLAQASDVMKLSRADIAACLAQGRTGATTVAATMIAAHLAGIHVFATGGIGGVHRGAETSFDISADLHELARTPVSVVAAGAKAILDLPKTLEVLETLGVPVIAYGQDDFPAFWSRSSGLAAPLRMNSAAEIASAHLMRARLGLNGGQLIANPIPEPDEIDRDQITPVIETALREAEAQGIAAKAVTPFLLARIFELTEGRSLKANIALVLNNARLGAAIAEQEFRPGITHEIRDLGWGIGGIERQKDDTRPDRPGDDRQHVGTFLQLQRHPVAGPKPHGHQRPGKPCSAVGKGGMADPPPVRQDQEIGVAPLVPPEESVVKMISHGLPLLRPDRITANRSQTLAPVAAGQKADGEKPGGSHDN